MRKTKGKACNGTVDGVSYAFLVDGVDGSSFFGLPFGRRMDTAKKLVEFQDHAEHAYVDTKMKKTLPAVKKWVRDNKPDQFLAAWTSETDFYHDDSVKIFYTQREDEEQS